MLAKVHKNIHAICRRFVPEEKLYSRRFCQIESSAKNWVQTEVKQVRWSLGALFGKLIVWPLELAVVVSDWMEKHVGMGAAWLAIVVIIFGSGFIPVAALAALVGHMFGFNSHWIIVGVIGGIVLDVFIIWADLQVAAH